MYVSCKSCNLAGATLPPPPLPPTFLKTPAGKIVYVELSAQFASFLKTIVPNWTAFCLVFSTSLKVSYAKFAIASVSDAYWVLP